MKNLLEEALSQLRAKNIIVEVVRQLSSGKEAVVYLVSMDRKLYVLKVYKDYAIRSFKSNQVYFAGKHIGRPSERKAVAKRNKFGKNLLHRLWVKREFYLLKKLFDSGINVPEPIAMSNTAILMEYIGDEISPAPLLKNVKLSPKEAKAVYKKLIDDIDTMLENGIVHGDLSPYNVLYWQGKPYIIDFPQAVDVRNNPNWEELLERDRERVEEWGGEDVSRITGNNC